jgi:glycogen debranching enzyme
VFAWTGDEDFLKEMYPYIKRGIHWLLTEQDQNRNMFPEGYGIMEVRGLNAELIDVAVYTQQALEAASKMAAILKEPTAEKDYASRAEILKNKINMLFWDESDGSYCDFYGTRAQAITTTKAAVEQLQMDIKAGQTVTDKQQRFYHELLQRLATFPEGQKKVGSPIRTG